jgi:hypothetical protein
LRDFVQRQKGTERTGAKVEKEAALARHYGDWITIGFQGFVHSWLLVGLEMIGLARKSRCLAQLRMPRRGGAMQDWRQSGRIGKAGLAKVKQGSAYTRDELSLVLGPGV